jgi:phage shock protein E
VKNLFHPAWVALCLALFSLLSFSAQAENYSYNGTNSKVVIDVRTAEEFASGHVQGAINIPYDQIAENIKSIPGLKKEDSILLYCRSGHRAGIAKQTLENIGFTKVQNGGGIDYLVQKLKVCKGASC